MQFRVLLTTTVSWPSAARFAAAFAGLGARVALLAPRGAPAMKSRFVQERVVYRPLSPQAALAQALTTEPDLVMPLDDRAVAHLLRLQAPVIARSLGRLSSYTTLMARSEFLVAARALGIAVPLTLAVSRESDLNGVLASTGLLAVLKADGSWGGDGVAVVRSLEEAQAAFRRFAHPPSALRSLARAMRRGDAHFLRDAFRPPQPAISVQAFVEGRPATTAFACWGGRLLGAVHADVLAAQGGMGPATVLRRVGDPVMERAAEAVALRFGLSGLHGLDYMRDAAGAVHLLESNPRATQLAALAFVGAPDLVAALASAAMGREFPARAPAIAGDTVALFPQEWQRDPASPWLADAHHDVPADDPDVIQACLGRSQVGNHRGPRFAA